MTDDEINKLVAMISNEPSDDELRRFARAIEQRTLTNQKAKWYQEGVESEREACAKIVDDETDEWESRDICAILRQVASDIRARGESNE